MRSGCIADRRASPCYRRAAPTTLISALPVELIHFASYKPPYSGSFVPMVREVLLRAQARGWDAAAVFPEEARERDWARSLAEEVEVSFRPPTRATVEEVLSTGRTTILHTHFTTYDLPAAFAA